MKTENSFFDRLNSIVRKRHKAIVATWILVLVVSAPLIAGFFHSISFDITAGSSALTVSNSESQEAMTIIDQQFPKMNTTSAGPIVVAFQDQNVYSDQVKEDLFSLNKTLGTDPGLHGFLGIASVYTTEQALLDSTIPEYVAAVANLTAQYSSSPEASAYWDAAAKGFANSTSSLFAGSPVFRVNGTSLYSLLAGFNASTTAGQIHSAITSVLTTENIGEYPYVLETPLTQNLVSPQNTTMLFELNFTAPPSNADIAKVKTLVHGSALAGEGTLYVTGGAVLTTDFQNAAQPALSNSIVPGFGVAMLMAGLLFLSPIAALVPILVGGISIGISLGAVEGLIVDVQHSQINFTVPFLMILTMLGLAVDYSVLQLRRTREERSKGRPFPDSVATSLRWAGQAILTAGITVVAAYIVLAVTKVPFFGAVGVAVALGVAVLLVASLTLLPSLEMMLGDRVFWPRGSALSSRQGKRGMLDRVAEATIKRKAAVVVVISLLAVGSFYVAYETPNGFDFTRLIPNFESNQGLTVITNNFGGLTAGPTQVVLTLPSAVVTGKNQFNQTELKLIDQITQAIASSKGVDGVASPSRPFGVPFNYSDLAGFSAPVQSQYVTSMLSMVGINGKTVLINAGLAADSESPTAVSYLKGVENAVNAIHLPVGATIYFGGGTQGTVDILSLIDGVLPLVLLILAVAVYFILFAQLRSVFTPFRLIFTILCSVAFALALLAVAFYYLLDTPIVSLAPLFVIVTMLGVGIDYDIFLVTRIREEAMNRDSDIDAIRYAVDKTWVTLLGLGLILASVYSSLVISGIGLLQEIGVSVAAAVMIDVGVVILFFVPALMAIAQKYNWWPGRVREARTDKA